jgi:hypothetical protein
MATLDDIINQSFQDELSNFNKKKVKSGESNNVAKLFQEVQLIRTDCNICYENNAECIQCYQCDFKYCQECLTKVISEFTRCSACNTNFKDNYTQIKNKNKKKPTSILTAKSTKISKDNYANANASANANANQDLLSDYEIEQLTILLQMENIHLKPNNKKPKNINYINNKSTQNTSSNLNNTLSYLDNEFDDEIEACQFQTVKPNSKYNFRVQQNTNSNELIYTSNDNNLYPIILNYKLLDKCFQRTVFICLVELVDKPNIFPNVWQTVASLISNFTCNYDYLIHNRNIKNQTFLYQKQDLINTINQITSYY